jgi:hypothetical protein
VRAAAAARDRKKVDRMVMKNLPSSIRHRFAGKAARLAGNGR